MFDFTKQKPKNKRDFYKQLHHDLHELIDHEPAALANIANVSALLWDQLEDINWAGFYLMEQGELVLGPFQGKPACVHIAIGSGVCGTAVAENKTMLIEDVHAFPGHIACDSASNSEIVIPIRYQDHIVGVLDIDSPSLNRFDLEDQAGLEALVEVLEQQINWSTLIG